MPHRTSIASHPTPWAIQLVTPETQGEVLDFIHNARKSMFPGLHLTPDNEMLFGPGSCFLEASDGQDLIAVIGYVPYNHRFPQFDYSCMKTAEVVRLYVLPQYRRYGLAAALFCALRERAIQDKVACFYLHTHPFLPGAIKFWEKHGSKITQVEDDPVWHTTHMEAVLKTEAR
jgi:ribosomal protein S18 acetylase RimI-like enzyme